MLSPFHLQVCRSLPVYLLIITSGPRYYFAFSGEKFYHLHPQPSMLISVLPLVPSPESITLSFGEHVALLEQVKCWILEFTGNILRRVMLDVIILTPPCECLTHLATIIFMRRKTNRHHLFEGMFYDDFPAFNEMLSVKANKVRSYLHD